MTATTQAQTAHGAALETLLVEVAAFSPALVTEVRTAAAWVKAPGGTSSEQSVGNALQLVRSGATHRPTLIASLLEGVLGAKDREVTMTRVHRVYGREVRTILAASETN